MCVRTEPTLNSPAQLALCPWTSASSQTLQKPPPGYIFSSEQRRTPSLDSHSCCQ